MLPKVLIVEDDKNIRTLIADYCRASNYSPLLANNGEQAMRLFESDSPDIVLLDIIMPKLDGFEVCRQIRSVSATPIIMISSKKDDADKILSLKLGADDYVEKPFSPRVLMAKISALLRRTNELSGNNHNHQIGYKDLIIDSNTRMLNKNGNKIELSKIEFDILFLLMQNPDQVFSKEKIYDNVWGIDEYGDISTVTVHINKLRNKIEENPSNPKYIKTIRGVGYVLR